MAHCKFRRALVLCKAPVVNRAGDGYGPVGDTKGGPRPEILEE